MLYDRSARALADALLLALLICGCTTGTTASPRSEAPTDRPMTPSPPSSLSPSPSPSPAGTTYDPFAGKPFTMSIPKGWIAAGQPADWAEAVEAYDLRYPGDLPARHAYRLPVDVFMPAIDPNDVVALRLDGPMMLSWVQEIGELTPEEALQSLEAKVGDYFGEMAYGPSPPPDLESDVARVTVPAGPAVKVELSWTDAETGRSDYTGFCIIADTTAYFVTFRYGHEEAGSVLRDISAMVGSLDVD